MRIVDIEKLEDCFDGEAALNYRFDEPWTREWILRLRELGTVDYFPDFPRPFFRLRASNGMQAKGIEGEATIHAIFARKGKEVQRHEFECFFDRE